MQTSTVEPAPPEPVPSLIPPTQVSLFVLQKMCCGGSGHCSFSACPPAMVERPFEPAANKYRLFGALYFAGLF